MLTVEGRPAHLHPSLSPDQPGSTPALPDRPQFQQNPVELDIRVSLAGTPHQIWHAERVRTSVWTAFLRILECHIAEGLDPNNVEILRRRAKQRFNQHPDALWWVHRRASLTVPDSLVHPGNDYLIKPDAPQPRRGTSDSDRLPKE